MWSDLAMLIHIFKVENYYNKRRFKILISKRLFKFILTNKLTNKRKQTARRNKQVPQTKIIHLYKYKNLIIYTKILK